MRRLGWLALFAVCAAGVVLGVLRAYPDAASGKSIEGPAAVKAKPASKVEAIPGSKVKKVTLSGQEAARRLDIQTAPVREQGTTKVVPEVAVFYDPAGGAWVFTEPEPLVFIRQKVAVLRLENTLAVLSEGPAVGTLVVTVGAAELYGAETGVGK